MSNQEEEETQPTTTTTTTNGGGKSSSSRSSVADEWKAGVWSKITFGWLFPLIKLGHERQLIPNDIGDNDFRDLVQEHLELLENNLQKGTKDTFRNTIIQTFSRLELYAVLCKLVSDAMAYVTPFSINFIVSYAEQEQQQQQQVEENVDNDTKKAYAVWLVALAMFVSVLITSFSNHWFYQFVMIDGLHARTAIQAAVYSKTMKLSLTKSNNNNNESDENENNETSNNNNNNVSNTITNLYSTDCVAIEMVYQMWMYAWSAPLQLIVATVLLYLELGWPAFVGIGILVFVGPLQKQLIGILKQDTIAASEASDRRIQQITQVLQGGMQVIKLQAWETIFAQQIEDERTKELKHRKHVAFTNGANTGLTECAPIVSTVITFVVYGIFSNEPLTAAKAFTALSLFNLLRLPLMILPMMIGLFASAVVASNRLADFFYSPELETYVQRESFPDDKDKTVPLVEVHDSSFVWPQPPSKPTMGKEGADDKLAAASAADAKLEEAANLHLFRLVLDDLTLTPGTLTVVTGTVGSGKSSVLSAILGEMDPLHKDDVSVTLRGSISYCSQEPWIQNATVRDNILFGSPFDATKYETVLQACALHADIAALPGGDMTEIGERGINLSGGQKARVSLARACYADTDIVVLDDILSAVDAHVARTITDKCLVELLRNRGKTVVLATHQTLCLPSANKIVVMKDGSIDFQGDFAATKAAGKLPYNFGKTVGEATNGDDGGESSGTTNAISIGAEDLPSTVEEGLAETKETEPATETNEEKGKLTAEEKSEEGAVTLAVYLQYLKLMGIPMCVLILLLAVGVNGSQVAVNWWLARWSVSDGSDMNYYLFVYMGIALGACLCIFSYQIVFVIGGMLAAAGLHSNLLQAVLHAPMSFFDTTPSGQILNRFTIDMRAIDESLVKQLSSAMNLLFMMFFVILTMVSVIPYILIAIVPLFIFYGWVQRVYRNTARELKRFDSTTQSPIFNFFVETIDGLPSVRAFECQDRLLGLLKGHVDNNTRFWTKSNFVNRWLGLRLDIVGAMLMGCAALSCVLAIEFEWVSDAGLIGLVLSYTATLTGLLNWGVRNFSEAEMGMVAVERTRAMMGCPQEVTKEPLEVPPSWPSEGSISLQGVCVRYRESLPKVLNGLDLEIPGGTTVGVCGRTGSGKSTLAKCLFRLVEATEGSIKIDGRDIARIELEDLRSKISMIPQDPILFAGPLRFSLDPANRCSDAELWKALDAIGMKTHVAGLPGGLDTTIASGGENLSAGQRQLLCMARALLEKCKVLIMDEATSNIDGEADGKIQNMLKEAFEGCTILTIAHRIDTILWYDKALVLDQGKVLEFDSPGELSKREGSEFKALLTEFQKGRGETEG